MLAVGIHSNNYRTVAVAATPLGEIIAAQIFPRKGLSFYQEDIDSLAVELYEVLRFILYKSHVRVADFSESDSFLCIGLTGVNTAHDRSVGCKAIARELNLDSAKMLMAGNVELAFIGAAHEARGSAVSCNLASVAFAQGPGGAFRVGGWGPFLGDEGLFSIGRSAANYLCKIRDGRSEHDREFAIIARPIVQQALVRVGLESNWRYQSPSDWIDALMPLTHTRRAFLELRQFFMALGESVVAAWESGHVNPIADELVAHLLDDLYTKLDTVARRADAPLNQCPVVLGGAALLRHPKLGNALRERIQNESPGARVLMPNALPERQPVIGALMAAITRSVGSLPTSDVLDTIRETSRQVADNLVPSDDDF